MLKLTHFPNYTLYKRITHPYKTSSFLALHSEFKICPKVSLTKLRYISTI